MDTSFVNSVGKDLFKNATIFLNAAVTYINLGINTDEANRLLAIIHTQMAVEAALKYYVVEYFGVREIIDKKYGNFSDKQIEKEYYNNKLKTKDFEMLKNFAKSDKCALSFDSTQYKYLERFQIYRNKIVHLQYTFTLEEEQSMESDIIFIIAHILGILMGGAYAYNEKLFMQDYLYHKEYVKLINNPVYYKELTKFLQGEYTDVYLCPDCLHHTLTPDKKCLSCLLRFDDEAIFGYARCGYCGKDTVIYDALNIVYNQNTINGLCLNCENDATVYLCPKCGKAINIEFSERNDCTIERCQSD